MSDLAGAVIPAAPPPLGRSGFAALRGLARQPERRGTCEVCGAVLEAEHEHLFEPKARQISCVCEGCAVGVGQQTGMRYVRVSRRVCYLKDFNITEAQWDDLLIPVGMAFFFYNTPAGRVLAFYPGAAGVTESLLDLGAWDELVAGNPVLATMQPDVEALLVNRVAQESEYYLAPIDKCYELAGLIRTHWRGLAGGARVWTEIAGFYSALKARAGPEASHA